MLQRIETELPECSYHSPETGRARAAAAEAVAAYNGRVSQWNEQSSTILAGDPATVEGASLFAGGVRSLCFEIRQEELKALRLISAFYRIHKRDSQTVLQSQDSTREEQDRANQELADGQTDLAITHRIGTAENMLRKTIQTYLAV